LNAATLHNPAIPNADLHYINRQCEPAWNVFTTPVLHVPDPSLTIAVYRVAYAIFVHIPSVADIH